MVQIINDGASLRIISDSGYRTIQKSLVREVSAVNNGATIKLDIGTGAPHDIFIEYKDVTAPSTDTAHALVEAINTMLGGGPVGSGNKVARWGANGATLIDSQISDDGQNVSITPSDDLTETIGGNRTSATTGDDTSTVHGNRMAVLAGRDTKQVTGDDQAQVTGDMTHSYRGGRVIMETAELNTNGAETAFVEIQFNSSCSLHYIFSGENSDGTKSLAAAAQAAIAGTSMAMSYNGASSNLESANINLSQLDPHTIRINLVGEDGQQIKGELVIIISKTNLINNNA